MTPRACEIREWCITLSGVSDYKLERNSSAAASVVPVPDIYQTVHSVQRYMSWNNDIRTLRRAGRTEYLLYRRGIIQFEPMHPRYSGLDHTDKAVIEFLSRGFFGSKKYKRVRACLLNKHF